MCYVFSLSVLKFSNDEKCYAFVAYDYGRREFEG